MGDKTGISWTDHTFNRWWICTKVTDACKFCYAESWAKALGRTKRGYVAGEPRQLSKSHNLKLLQKWDRLAEKDGRKHMVFAHSMSDVFDREVPDEWRREEFDWFGQTKNLIFQVLTKRADYPAEYYPCNPYPAEKIWLGTSLGSNKDIDMAWDIVEAPAHLHWISYEPALGPLYPGGLPMEIKWLVIGGESGVSARPFNIEWAREAIRQCRMFGIKVFMKQLGSNAYLKGDRFRTKDSHGADPEEWPADLQIQEFPE